MEIPGDSVVDHRSKRATLAMMVYGIARVRQFHRKSFSALGIPTRTKLFDVLMVRGPGDIDAW